MNKEKRVTVKVLADIVDTYHGRTLPSRVLLVLSNSISALHASEELSAKKMEPFKDMPTTAANYRVAVNAAEDLQDANSYLHEGDLETAWGKLMNVVEPGAPDRAVKKTTTRKKRAS